MKQVLNNLLRVLTSTKTVTTHKLIYIHNSYKAIIYNATGNPEGCRKFLLACELYLAEFPDFTPMQKLSAVVQCLTGRALDWALVIWRWGGASSSDYGEFVREFKALFDHPDQGQSSSQRLLQLRQGSDSVSDYTIRFQILVAESGWNDSVLLLVFCHGLTPELQLERAARYAENCPHSPTQHVLLAECGNGRRTKRISRSSEGPRSRTNVVGVIMLIGRGAEMTSRQGSMSTVVAKMSF